VVAIAEQRAAAADSKCAATSFRPLTDSETEALVGADLLATLAESVGELKSSGKRRERLFISVQRACAGSV
jgi:hypothetical protein